MLAWDAARDQRTGGHADELAQLGVASELGGDGVDLLERQPSLRTLVRSPGIPLDAPVVRAAQARGMAVLDEAELGWLLDDRAFVGVTGTNGKGTVIALAREILHAAGRQPLVGGNTYFGPPLSATADLPGDIVLAELSSFQLEGCDALRPHAAVLTNLTEDHLYRHRTIDEYGACKRRLFVRDGVPVEAAAVGVDQEFGRGLCDELRALGGHVISFGRHQDAQRRILEVRATVSGSTLTITEGDRVRTLATRLRGEHNAANAAAALALADALEIDSDLASSAIAQVPPLPGRFELLDTAAPFVVVVDYAHNPDGIRATLEAARGVLAAPAASLRVVLSCLPIVGERQAWAMGNEAARLADHLTLTRQGTTVDDSEGALPPGLREGAQAANGATVELEFDRAKAIETALVGARPTDVVAILGRGERDAWWKPGGVRASFDDRAHARSCLSRMARRAPSHGDPERG